MGPTPAEMIDRVTAAPGRRGGRRAGNPYRVQPLRPPRLAPDIAALLAGLARRLAAATPDDRRQAVAGILACPHPGAVGAAADAVVDALRRSRSDAARAGLASALAMLGPAAMPAVRLALLKAKAGWQQAALAGVMERTGPDLPPRDRADLTYDLMRVMLGAPDEAAAAAADRALASIRAPPARAPDG